MRIIAVPVKSLERSKTRLAGVLSPIERAALTLAMLEDVLDACLGVPGWATWVVSPDETILDQAARRRAEPVPEEAPGLLTALRQVEDMATGQADALAVILGDVPLATPAAIARATHTVGSVVAVASASDAGTNLLLRRPPAVIPSRFGRDSFRKHREAADLRGVPFASPVIPELAFDLDRPGDVPHLLRFGESTRSRAACLEMGLPDRLSETA